MSPDGDWGSLGAQMRMDEDGAMPAFSDPLRDAKNSPTQSNFSAPDNLQGGSPLFCLYQGTHEDGTACCGSATWYAQSALLTPA